MMREEYRCTYRRTCITSKHKVIILPPPPMALFPKNSFLYLISYMMREEYRCRYRRTCTTSKHTVIILPPPNGLISCHPGILIVLCPGSEKHHQHCSAAKRSHKLKCISNVRSILFLGWTHLTPSSSLFAGPALALVRQLITSLNFDTILRTVCTVVQWS